VLTTPPRKKLLVRKPYKKTYVRRSRFFKNCRATEEEEEEGVFYLTSSYAQQT
jgi:hypothetical protein